MKNSGTREWSAHSANILNGCKHGCLYCYASAMSARFNRLPSGGWTCETLKPGISDQPVKRKSGRVMFPTAHDITPEHLEEAITHIERQLAAGNELLIVSKPHLECIREICAIFTGHKDKIMFRFSIGSTDDTVLSFWEPGAPPFAERLECLQLAHASGFPTSVSAEPMLEGNIDALIAAVSPFVTDAIWLGKINRLKLNLRFNGYTTPEILERAQRLEASQNDEAVGAIYEAYRDNPKVKFKESIKRVVGIPLSSVAGADV